MAQPSVLEQYRIADFLDWHGDKRLRLNPDFQRGSVWTPAARIYLIDTILRQLPIPKIYMRTTIDVETKKSVREVVDGQQRLRAIIDFASDKITLTKRAGEYVGKKYSTLSEEDREQFLSYPIAVGQLVNATDDDVLEVFSRLNSYSVSLNRPEKRHAKFHGEFKWSVTERARKWAVLWEEYRIVGVRDRVRKLDDSLMSEMYGVILEGVRDGGQAKIDKLYKRHDSSFNAEGEVPSVIDEGVQFFVDNLAADLKDTRIISAPHFLMLFAALTHALRGIPTGEMDDDFPERQQATLSNIDIVRDNLLKLASIMDAEEEPTDFEEFWRASRSSTQRIASRRIRFPMYYVALLPRPL